MPRKPARIFTVDMGDFWDSAFTQYQRGLIFLQMEKHPEHRFIILTKQPQNIQKDPDSRFPPNLFMGVTVDLPGMEYRINELLEAEVGHPIVSFEPLLGEVDPELAGIEWVIIGAQTNPRRYPPWGMVEWIINECKDLGIPYFVKDNLRIPFINHRQWNLFKQDYPEGLIFT